MVILVAWVFRMSEVPLHLFLPLQGKEGTPQKDFGLLPEGQDQDQVLNVFYVPGLLCSGTGKASHLHLKTPPATSFELSVHPVPRTGIPH